MPTLTGDELELIFVRGLPTAGVLHVARRTSIDERFAPAREIAELSGERAVLCPALSEDGLTLVYQKGTEQSGEVELMLATRADRTSAWSRPVPLPIAKDAAWPKMISCPRLSQDGLTLWYCRGDRTQAEVFQATRPSRQAEFGSHQKVVIQGMPLVGRFPRYVPATNELFYAANLSGNALDWSLFVIKNFSAPRAQSPGQ